MVLHWSLIESSGLFSWFGYDIQGKINTCQLSYAERAWGAINMESLIEELTEDSITRAPQFAVYPFSCSYCLFWERPEDFRKPVDRETFLLRKRVFIQSLRKSSDSCRKIAFVNGKAVAYLLYASPALLPGLSNYDHLVVPDGDSLFLACLFIPERRFRGTGIADELLNCTIGYALKHSYRAVETIARRGYDENPSGPVRFYEKRGFSIAQDHEEFPLVRLDLTQSH